MKTFIRNVSSRPARIPSSRLPVCLRKWIAIPLLLASSPWAQSAVPSTDITLQPVITQGLPVITSLSGYAYSNDSDAVSTTIGGTVINYDAPLFYPYDVDTTQWWDNMVAEQIQGRLPIVLLPTRGAYTLTPTDLTGPGNLNPRRLTQYIAALTRAGASSLFKAACFVDSPALKDNYDSLYGFPSTTKMDLSNSTAWNDIVWLRTVKPWFDTIPSQYWHTINGKPVIQWWSISSAWFINQSGNAKLMLQFISDQFNATYGVRPCFIIDGPWATSLDPSSLTQPDVIGVNSWFGSPTTSYTYTALDSFISGTSVPGFINPNVFNPSDPNYNSPNLIIQHNKVDSSGVNGDTLIAGLDAAVSSNANFTVIEGWNDVREWAGIYRCITSPRYDFPSQYINIVRQYTDLRTVTLRVEAEGADAYSDTTTGNSNGTVFRRSGDLDVRWLGGSPSISASSQNAPGQAAANAFDGLISTRWVTSVNGPGWIQYNYGTGNAKTVTAYALTSASDTPQRDPKDWQFQGSNDGSTWTTLDTRTGETFATRLLVKSYTVSSPASYQYYRLNITANSGGSSYGIHLQEIAFTTSAEVIASGWAVNNTAANEWVEFKKIYFSPGNYTFPIRYSAVTAGKRVRLTVDGATLGDVTLPATGGVDAFDTISLGQKTIGWGTHTLRILFLDGGVDLDWLFVRKADPMISFQAASNGSYLSASNGGNSTVVASGATIGDLEKFSADDTNGGSLSANDVINLQSYDGLLLCAEGAGGGALSVNRRRAGSFEQFTIVKTNGTTGALVNGDTVALRSNNGKYVTVGSGNVLNVTSTTIGTAQTFTITLGTQ